MRCARCGNENPAHNRFCGMCGTTLLQPAPQPPAINRAPQPPTAPPPVPVPPVEQPTLRREEPARENAPVVSGPSFLGLNTPPPPKTADASSNPRNLDYLLEDDEPKGSGWGKTILIFVALALAIGLGYLRWRNQGFPWLNLPRSKPAATTQNPEGSDSNSPPPSAATNSANAPISNQPANSPAANPPSTTPQNGQTSTSAPATSAPGPSTPAGTQAATPSTAPAPQTNTATPPANPAGAPATSTPPNSNPPPAADNSTPASGSATSSDTPDPAAESQPQPPPKPRPVDPVTEAQKYLYGRGAPQDCGRGMKLLRPSASQGNPKAMVEMGALYSAGLCAPRDLPTAYRWFALALRKQPDNHEIQGDLSKLWGEMTQPERQLAIRMTQ